jgi:NAD(P)-dependent dehydrogenase (short-subunit alcohol dehydrogenase family)
MAVITGASTGIGAATARELARRGFHVLAGVRRDRDADAIRAPLWIAWAYRRILVMRKLADRVVRYCIFVRSDFVP